MAQGGCRATFHLVPLRHSAFSVRCLVSDIPGLSEYPISNYECRILKLVGFQEHPLPRFRQISIQLKNLSPSPETGPQLPMTCRPRWLEREEKLALFYSLIVTGALAVYLQQLKENGEEEGSFRTLVEYEEFSVPSTRRRVSPEADRLRSKGKAQRVERVFELPGD